MLREVLTYPPGCYIFRLGDYPELAAVIVAVQGGHGGAASDGTPGEPGELTIRGFGVDQMPDHLHISVGSGEPGGPGGEDGGPAFVLLELYW